MNTTKQQITSSFRKRLYTYYVLSFTLGGNTVYLKNAIGATTTFDNALRFENKTAAKEWLRVLRKSRSQCGITLKSMNPNIKRIRGLSKSDTRILELTGI